jgi:preprotein translocase subunit SecA
MFKKVAQALGADPQKKQLEKYQTLVEQINKLEKEKFEPMSDGELRAITTVLRKRLAEGETIENVLPEAFTAVREASKRTIGLRHYDVQLIGGMVLHEGKIAEMRTGEGKTLVATLPLYLNSLAGKGAHLITVNDYLARRDARWMGPIFDALGMSVGVLQMSSRTENARNAFLVDLSITSNREDQHQLRSVLRRDAYAADITYGTNSEFGFDYLRDNLTMSLFDRVQRGHYYAIVDEVDNILIDEARTPLIISGPAADESQWYSRMAQIVKQLKPEDYEFNEKEHSVALTEPGEARVEELLGVTLRDPDRPEDINPEQARLMGYLEQCLRAKLFFKKNKDYIIQSGQVIIVDEFTGRLMPGRRWSEGLHQAVEALEGVRVHPDNITHATITLQNYFRKYEKLAGMTGTALTEAEEFYSIYKLDVLSIPTNLDYLATIPTADLSTSEAKDEQGYPYDFYFHRDDPRHQPIFWKRKDYPDIVYRTTEAKLRAITQEIIQHHIIGRPLLVGTASVEHSELLSSRLQPQPLRRLLQTLLLEQKWLDSHKVQYFDRVVPELQFLNEPLEKVNPHQMQQLAHTLELLSLNPDDKNNLPLLLKILELNESHQDRLLDVIQHGVKHNILNARNHEEESKIIANAGAFGSVMIATNMAGRGIDIKLGGNLPDEVMPDIIRVLKKANINPFDMSIEDIYVALGKLNPQQYGIYDAQVKQFQEYHEKMKLVRELGGLHVIGSERHEARRIDNQLRGRAARQGDPGSTRFYLSLEDDLLRLFGQDRRDGLMKLLNYNDLMPLEHKLIGRLVEQAQERVEGYNFDIRKHLLEYDDVLNAQRERIYNERDKSLTKPSVMDDVLDMLHTELERRIPLALQDSDGPWKLLSYLEEIQPTTVFEQENVRIPSFTLRVLLDELKEKLDGHRSINSEMLISSLVDLTKQALEAEKVHLLSSAGDFLDRSYDAYQKQIIAKLDEVDIYFDGLRMQARENPQNPKAILNEIQSNFNVRLSLTPEQSTNLIENSEQIQNVVKDEVRIIAMKTFLGRVAKAFGRRMEDSIEIPVDGLVQENWAAVREGIFSVLEKYIDSRKIILCGDDGQLAKNITLLLKGQEKIDWDENLLLELISRMAEVTRTVIDPRSHQRVLRKAILVNFIYLVAHQLENQDVIELTKRVLNHLENVQKQLQMTYGRMEVKRIFQPQTVYEQLEPGIQMRIASTIGIEAFNLYKNQSQTDLQQPPIEQLCNQLGEGMQNSIYRFILLSTISRLWIEHLTHMEGLRVSISMESYAQRDPLVQYKSEGTDAFKILMDNIRMGVINLMFRTQPALQKSASSSKSTTQGPPVPQKSIGQSYKNQKHKKHRH